MTALWPSVARWVTPINETRLEAIIGWTQMFLGYYSTLHYTRQNMCSELKVQVIDFYTYKWHTSPPAHQPMHHYKTVLANSLLFRLSFWFLFFFTFLPNGHKFSTKGTYKQFSTSSSFLVGRGPVICWNSLGDLLNQQVTEPPSTSHRASINKQLVDRGPITVNLLIKCSFW